MRGRIEAFRQLFDPKVSENGQKPPVQYREIGKVVWQAALISHETSNWRTILLQSNPESPEQKSAKRKAAGHNLVKLLTTEVIGSPDFYTGVDGLTHLKTFQLLAEISPAPYSAHQLIEEFALSPAHQTIQVYLAGVDRHQAIPESLMTVDVMAEDDYRYKLGQFLLKNASFNLRYLNMLFAKLETTG